MEDSVHQISFQLINTLNSSLASYHAQNPILGDVSLQVILHIISCTSALRDVLDSSKSKSDVQSHLYLPLVNGLLGTLGKVIMESFAFQPKALDVLQYSTCYHLLLRHTLRLFPEMTTKRHKSSGKVLLHHVVFKARPAVAVETVQLLLALSPQSAQVADTSGALPLHWATRNEDLPVEVIDLLVAAYPVGASLPDARGFLPLHWAVNQDAPNVDVVRRLLKLHPKAASTPTSLGCLPLHYCVSRERPHPAVLKALMAAYPDGIRYRCEEGCLPLHRFLQRTAVDVDSLRQLVNFFPDALLVTNLHKQTPLHLALDQSAVCDEAVAWLVQQGPLACGVQDMDGYHPLHMLLDHPHPNYALAEEMLRCCPAAAGSATNDMLMPLHLVLAVNAQPSVPFLATLLRAHPRAVDREVQDIVPAVEGEALADPDSWSGEWVERIWKPLDRARDRGLDDVVALLEDVHRDPNLLHTKYAHLSLRTQGGTGTGTGTGTGGGPGTGKGMIAQQPALAAVSSPPPPSSGDAADGAPGGGAFRPMAKFAVSTSSGVGAGAGAGAVSPPARFVPPPAVAGGPSPKERADILPFDPPAAFSPTTHTAAAPHTHSGAPPSLLVGNYVSGPLTASPAAASSFTLPLQLQPQLQPQVQLQHQLQPQLQHQLQSPGPQAGPGEASPAVAAAAAVAGGGGPPGSASGAARAPPSGPIPASLLQAAENNAMRLSRAQYDFLKGKKPAGKKKRPPAAAQAPALAADDALPAEDAAGPAMGAGARLAPTASLPTFSRNNNDAAVSPTRAATAAGPAGDDGQSPPGTAPLPPPGDDGLTVSSGGPARRASPNPQNFIKRGTNKLAAGGAAGEAAGGPGGAGAGVGAGTGGAAGGARSFATNHTAEIMRSLGGGGGARRVHPLPVGTDAV